MITGGNNIMKTFLDFSMGFVYGLMIYYEVGFFGALAVGAAGFIIGNLIIKYFEKETRNNWMGV